MNIEIIHRCLQVFSSASLLLSHVEDCKGISEKPYCIEMPEEGKNILKFVNHNKQMCVPNIIHADIKLTC